MSHAWLLTVSGEIPGPRGAKVQASFHAGAVTLPPNSPEPRPLLLQPGIMRPACGGAPHPGEASGRTLGQRTQEVADGWGNVPMVMLLQQGDAEKVPVTSS